MVRSLAFLLSLFLPLAVLAFAAVQLLYRMNVRPTLENVQTAQGRYSQPFIEDVNYLSRFELLKPLPLSKMAGSGRDAGPILNPLVRWSALPTNMILKNAGAAHSFVPVEMREELMRLRTEWMEKNFRAKRMNVNLKFLESLGQFDYWDIEAASPIGDLASTETFVPPPRLPIPEVADLMALAKLRLMQGALNHEPLKALTDVRNLARLMMTTENIHLLLTGLAVLDEERSAYRYFVDSETMETTSWIPVDRNVTRRARRAILAAREFLRLWTNPDLSNQIYLASDLPPGFCAAVNDALPVSFSLRPLLQPHWLLELDLRENYSQLAKILARAQSSCRLRYFNSILQADKFSIDIPTPLFLSRIPYFRKVFGLHLSTQDYADFDGYR